MPFVIGTLIGVSLSGCIQPNEAHCANLEGDATCAERSPDRPHCSLCFEPGGPDGCTDVTLPQECRAGPEVADDVTSAMTVETSSGLGHSNTGPATMGPDDTTAGAGETDPASSGGEPPLLDIPPSCGDGVANPGEQCDGSDLAGNESCDDISQGIGVLGCRPDCTYDTSGCCGAAGDPCMKDDDCCSGTCQLISLFTCAEI